MNHCPSEAKLLAYLDGQLAEPELQSLSPHLRGCSNCEQRLAALRCSLQEVDELLTELSEMPFRAATAPAAVPQPNSLKRIAAGAALAACVLLAMFLSTRPLPPYRVDRFISFDSRQDPIEFGTVIQVSVPASLFDPSNTDSRKVQAEVLLGDDGRPRAVRFLD